MLIKSVGDGLFEVSFKGVKKIAHGWTGAIHAGFELAILMKNEQEVAL